ncbi:DUF1990 family protein [Frigoribacterium sp. Leaf186]|uniref:DUF1990 family protein n=1 Tax=Frigoribacterium sp. Leaf186 TaxID=1736293 RepID=UPI0006FA443A|nr:DUF1990 domain-containing protein [Frigoribacterium sp. Leaf186]KQS22856.1 hypothetical protein ASG05_05060 [Frigoribacterium sp. Leaf186]
MTSHPSRSRPSRSRSPRPRPARSPRARFGDDYAFDGEPTLDGPPPAGFHVTTRSRVIGHGRAAFDAAGDAVLHWQVHRGSGFVPLDVPDRVTVGATSVWGVTFGPLHPPVACRVFAVVRSETEIAFGHAALVGHPQRGWESYRVRHHDDDRVTLDIRVVWHPAAWWMRAAGPASALALSLILRRNLRALDEVLASA